MDHYFEAGAAFGNGAHPSTSLTLAAIGELAPMLDASSRILDYGCGSGILMLAVAGLPHAVLAGVDREKIAVETTRRNLAGNGIAATVFRAARPDDPKLAALGPFDLIAANLLAELHVPLLTGFRAILASGGNVILSGILKWQEAGIVEMAGAAGLVPSMRLERDDWIALVLCAHVDETDPQIDVAREEGE